MVISRNTLIIKYNKSYPLHIFPIVKSHFQSISCTKKLKIFGGCTPEPLPKLDRRRYAPPHSRTIVHNGSLRSPQKSAVACSAALRSTSLALYSMDNGSLRSPKGGRITKFGNLQDWEDQLFWKVRICHL